MGDNKRYGNWSIVIVFFEILVMGLCVYKTVIPHKNPVSNIRLDKEETNLEGVEELKHDKETEKESEMRIESMTGSRLFEETISTGTVEDKEETVFLRIRLTTSDYQSEYHPYVMVSCTDTIILECGEKQQIYTGGQTVLIAKEHTLFQNGSIRVRALNDALRIDSIAHRGESQIYPGTLELYLEEQGIRVINEVELEEYVKRVVPSEMPADYGLEAACLQAVCARTYAYEKLYHNKTDQYGSIANDSVSYQVYNACGEKEISSKGVEQTMGMILVYQEEPIIPYYFSTSCGFNTDNTSWGGSALPYLRTQNLTFQETQDMQNEDTFRNVILNWEYPAYEDDCTWYRWNYTITLEQLKQILPKRLHNLLGLYPDHMEAQNNAGEKCPVNPLWAEHIVELEIGSRKYGGIAGSVNVCCEEGIITVSGEMAIRILLGAPEQIYSNQASAGFGTSEGAYLPSAFFCLIEQGKDEWKGYTICGGGNGHGIGLSQNGANALLKQGLNWREVLQFFYLGTKEVHWKTVG